MHLIIILTTKIKKNKKNYSLANITSSFPNRGDLQIYMKSQSTFYIVLSVIYMKIWI